MIFHFNSPFCGPAYAMRRAVPRSVPSTIAVTINARFCEQTATPSPRGGLPLLLSPLIIEKKRKESY